MSLPTLTFRTLCTDPRCVSVQRCQRAEHERYGNAPGENYGPRCVPVPNLDALRAEVEELREENEVLRGLNEGEPWARAHVERRTTARIVAYLREQANAEHPIERGVPSLSPAGRGLLLLHADRIWRGEHLRSSEGEK